MRHERYINNNKPFEYTKIVANVVKELVKVNTTTIWGCVAFDGHQQSKSNTVV